MNAEILIVEDEGLIAIDLKKKLEQAGYSVLAIVDNSEDALSSVEVLRPSLVLMDIRLRGPIDGVETADQIRRRFHVPVIFVTAHADRETLNRARCVMGAGSSAGVWRRSSRSLPRCRLGLGGIAGYLAPMLMLSLAAALACLR